MHSAGSSRRRSESNATGGTPRGSASPRARPRAASRAAAFDAESAGAAAAAAVGGVSSETLGEDANTTDELRATGVEEEAPPPTPPAAGSNGSENVDATLSRTLGLSDAQLEQIKSEIMARLAQRLRQPGAVGQWSGSAAGFEQRMDAAVSFLFYLPLHLNANLAHSLTRSP